MNTTARVLAVLLCTGLLTGCNPDGGTTTPTPTPTSTPTPSPTNNTAETAAIKAVKRFVQMTQVDLFTGEATLNDLPEVAAQPLLDLQRKASRDLLGQGWSSKSGGQVQFTDVKVVSATPKSDPATVIVRFCADATGIDYQQLDRSGKVTATNHGVRRGTTATIAAKDYGDGWFVTQTELSEC